MTEKQELQEPQIDPKYVYGIDCSDGVDHTVNPLLYNTENTISLGVDNSVSVSIADNVEYDTIELSIESFNQITEAISELLDGIEFYSDPEIYHSIGFAFDPPCGAFKDDFDEDHGFDQYDRKMPGKKARECLRAFFDIVRDNQLLHRIVKANSID